MDGHDVYQKDLRPSRTVSRQARAVAAVLPDLTVSDTMALQCNHPLVTAVPATLEESVLGLLHQKAYEEAGRFAQKRDVLDWGCNDGYGLKILTSVANRLAGLDTAEHCVQAARENVPAIASEIRLYTGQGVPFECESFDLVVSFQVIEHIEDCSRYLRDIKSVLRPGGVALFSTPNRLLRLDPDMKPWNSYHVTEYTPDTLVEMLAVVFPQTEVYGLHGSPELEAVERSRCARARAAARNEHPGTGHRRIRVRTKAVLRRVLGKNLTTGLRRLIGERQGPNNSPFPKLDECFSTRELRYSRDRLEDALDLFAVCRL